MVSEQYRTRSVKAALNTDKFCIGVGLTDPTSGILERPSAMRVAFFIWFGISALVLTHCDKLLSQAATLMNLCG